MKLTLTAFLVCILTFFGTSGLIKVLQQKECGEYVGIQKALYFKYEERIISRGLNREGNIIEWWQSESGNISILEITPNGVACFIDVGTDAHKPALRIPGEET